jgi:hypothetical protein
LGKLSEVLYEVDCSRNNEPQTNTQERLVRLFQEILDVDRVGIKDNMKHLVKVSDTTPKQHFNRFVFFRKIIKHYQSKRVIG